MKVKNNNGGKAGEKLGNNDHRKYCEFHESTKHDISECTMLHRELENKMQFGQLTDLIKGLQSKNLEAITPIEPKIKKPGKK